MESGKVHLSVDPFKLSYRDQNFPIAPDGHPTEIGDYSDALAARMLLDIPHLLSGEIRHIDFLDGPYELVFIPWGNEISIFLYSQTTSLYVNWQHISVPTGPWFLSLIVATRHFIEEASKWDFDPVWVSLEEIQYLCGFAEKLLKAHGYIDREEDVPC